MRCLRAVVPTSKKKHHCYVQTSTIAVLPVCCGTLSLDNCSKLRCSESVLSLSSCHRLHSLCCLVAHSTAATSPGEYLRDVKNVVHASLIELQWRGCCCCAKLGVVEAVLSASVQVGGVGVQCSCLLLLTSEREFQFLVLMSLQILMAVGHRGQMTMSS